MADYILQKTKEETALRRKKMYVSMPYNIHFFSSSFFS